LTEKDYQFIISLEILKGAFQMISKLALVTVEDSRALDNQMQISRVVADWVNHCDVSPLTQKMYNSAAAKFVSFVQNNGGLNEQTLINFREYAKQNFATATARLYFTVAKKFCQWTCKRMNVADFTLGVKGVKIFNDIHARDALTVEDCAKVINTFDDKNFISVRNKLIVSLMATLGLRTIEISRLDISDIEFRRGKYFLKIWGKARAGKLDNVALPKQLKEMIDKYLKLRGDVSDSEPLFISTSNFSKGKRLQTQSISRLTKKALRDAGFESKRLVAHSLRHSFATNALLAGVSVDKVQRILRHRSPATTQVYRHDLDEYNNDATETVARALFKFI
jgi:integrase/recombinase XerC